MADVELLIPAPNPEAEGEARSKGRDEREAIAAITSRTRRDPKEEEDFIASKVRLAKTHPGLDPDQKRKAVANVAQRLGRRPEEVEKEDAPVPGGVGYGVFYNSTFRSGFALGTSLNFQIVCPTTLGGNVNSWFYLTAMNRAGRGIEAFISYYGQQQLRFKVFDWARTDHWQVDCPYSSLGSYLYNVASHGVTYQIINVWNTTMQIGSGTWRNEALLWNRPAGRWDLIYRFDYAGNQSEQTSGWIGSWGPIVETFQSSYTGVRPVGALGTQLISRNSSGTWGSWGLVTASQSSIRNDNLGFTPRFLDPNYAFVVTS